ncbi:GNAT family N-acetyltransferase [Dyadobacter sp. LHD-138]|uniref:GNAT family N-acetyltransferase n=1 Tax=Dyadobacter sp. LHD-138 TaxID=3071413 RepID=UPI0027DEC298|nr:GNAT family N-acetyltransferase [Dyadobacter sp. LHD-138]MDQ6481323.1 GNAT family N-acetyltransferase [Dyadobacter sp. LHD-138]
MTLKLTNPSLFLRPIEEKDMPLLLEMYASTRKDEMERVPNWPEIMKMEFISGQFRAQHEHYQRNYPGAYFWVIELDTKQIGRLYLHTDYQSKEVRIIDITILPEFRNRKIGGGILSDLMTTAAEMQKPLRIHVESFNPAKNLYNRLGFKKISETNGVYHLMEWKHTI